MDADIFIKLPIDLEREVKELAEKEGLTLGDIVRRKLEEYVAVAKLATTPKQSKEKELSQTQIEINLLALERLNQFADEVGQLATPGLQAATLIDEMRR